MITVTLVGYGSSVFTFASKAVLVALIIIALITIPPQLNDVEKYMTAKTSYRSPYHPSAGDYHVIVCGHVNDKKKLSAFLKEFLHPDRMFSSSPQFHVVIMSTAEPRYIGRGRLRVCVCMCVHVFACVISSSTEVSFVRVCNLQ